MIEVCKTRRVRDARDAKRLEARSVRSPLATWRRWPRSLGHGATVQARKGRVAWQLGSAASSIGSCLQDRIGVQPVRGVQPRVLVGRDIDEVIGKRSGAGVHGRRQGARLDAGRCFRLGQRQTGGQLRRQRRQRRRQHHLVTRSAPTPDAALARTSSRATSCAAFSCRISFSLPHFPVSL